MKRSSSNKSAADSRNRGDAMQPRDVQDERTKHAALRRLDPDQAVERGSQALARHSSRKQFALICRWLVIASILLSGVGIVCYLAYPSLSQVPWQRYFDRFDFRLHSDIGPDEQRPQSVSEQTSQDDP